MSSMLISAILSVLVEVALTRPATWIAKGLKSKRARSELAEICSHAVEAAAQAFPEIREDVTSDSFIKFILLPMLEVTLEDPSQVPDAAALSKRYLEVFVDRFSGEGGPTDLPQLFRMDEGTVAPAFAAMLEALRSGLNASNFWRERSHHLTSEMTLSEVQTLREAIDRLLPEEMETPDLEAARRDARDGSTELRNWPRSISGHCMLRPELKRLLDRIEAEQSGTSLLALAAGAANLSAEGFEFLMNDVRRLWVGEVSVELEPGMTGHEAGFSSQELISAITPQLKPQALGQLRDHIEDWTIYGPGAADEESVDLRKARLRWSEQNRMALLDRLPPDILPARRRRQITEWRAKEPRPKKRTSLRTLAGWVGSPMSSQEMEKASDLTP